MYDDRILRVLQELGRGLNLDIRELVLQRESTPAAHEREDRPNPQEIAANYSISDQCREPAPEGIFVFDDLLTSGSHFKGMQSVLRDEYGAIPITGIFLARRVPHTDDPNDPDAE